VPALSAVALAPLYDVPADRRRVVRTVVDVRALQVAMRVVLVQQ